VLVRSAPLEWAAGGGQWWQSILGLQGGNTALLLLLPLLLHLRADGQQRVGVGQSGLPASSLGCHQGGPPALALTLNSLPLCQMTHSRFMDRWQLVLTSGVEELFTGAR
jgi:hypothetical protein